MAKTRPTCYYQRLSVHRPRHILHVMLTVACFTVCEFPLTCSGQLNLHSTLGYCAQRSYLLPAVSPLASASVSSIFF